MADDEWNDDGVDFGGTGPSDDGDVQDGSETESSEEWRFSLDDLDDDEREADGFSLYGEIEAGSPSVENAVFVGLGLVLGLVVFAGLFL